MKFRLFWLPLAAGLFCFAVTSFALDSQRVTKFNDVQVDDLVINGGDISGEVTFDSLVTATGGLALPSNAAPRTNVTPTAAGQLIWNSADKQVCVSTAATVTSWVQAADGTTACSH